MIPARGCSRIRCSCITRTRTWSLSWAHRGSKDRVDRIRSIRRDSTSTDCAGRTWCWPWVAHRRAGQHCRGSWSESSHRWNQPDTPLVVLEGTFMCFGPLDPTAPSTTGLSARALHVDADERAWGGYLPGLLMVPGMVDESTRGLGPVSVWWRDAGPGSAVLLRCRPLVRPMVGSTGGNPGTR